MRKSRLLTLFATLVMAGGLLYSCSKEESNTDQEQRNLKVIEEAPDCNTVCIEEGTGQFFPMTGAQTVYWGGKNQNDNSKVVDIEYYNTETHFVLKVKSTDGFSDLVINDVSMGIKADPNVQGTYTVLLPEGWQACDLYTLKLQVAGKGPQATFDVAYNLIGVCEGCDETFTYTENLDGTYTFVYTPGEDLTDKLVVFTFAQGTAVSGLDATWEVKGSTRQKVMSFEECVPVSWTVTLVGDCSGHGTKSNVWTDFKVDDISKKANESDIFVQTCPE